MTRIAFGSIHDIIVRIKEEKAIITVRNLTNGDVDIEMSKDNADFLRMVLNERFERGTKDDP